MPQNVSCMCSLNIQVLWIVFQSWKKKSGKALYRNLNILMYFFTSCYDKTRVEIQQQLLTTFCYAVQHYNVNPFTETFITTPRFLKRNTMATMFEALFRSVLLMWSYMLYWYLSNNVFVTTDTRSHLVLLDTRKLIRKIVDFVLVIIVNWSAPETLMYTCLRFIQCK